MEGKALVRQSDQRRYASLPNKPGSRVFGAYRSSTWPKRFMKLGRESESCRRCRKAGLARAKRDLSFKEKGGGGFAPPQQGERMMSGMSIVHPAKFDCRAPASQPR